MTGSDVHDMSYYQKCMVGGILSCGITHTLVCPLDIVKCRMQVRSPFLTACLGHARHVQERRRWIQIHQGCWRNEGFHTRKLLTQANLSNHLVLLFIELEFNFVVFRDGLQLWSDIPLKDLESSDSTRSSRMFLRVQLVQRTLLSTKPSDSQFPPLLLRWSLIVSCVLGKL